MRQSRVGTSRGVRRVEFGGGGDVWMRQAGMGTSRGVRGVEFGGEGVCG